MIWLHHQVNCSVHLFLIKEDNILLLKRCNTGYEDGKYSVVTGYLNPGEEIKAAMVREAREVVAIKLIPEDLDFVGILHRHDVEDRVDFFLTAAGWQGKVTNREPETCDELKWVPIFQLPDNMVPFVKKAILNFRNGILYDSYGWD